jgi:hypothetical protein
VLQGTTVAGIPIPLTSPPFVSVLVIHVAAGLVAVASGLIAMFSMKGRGRHSKLGTVYYWALSVVAATMGALSAMRWPEDRMLFGLGVFAFVAATVGRAAMRQRWNGWARFHITGMGTSYTVMLIAFYVDNGSHLPVWRRLPASSYWLLPLIIGTALIVRALLFHPFLHRSSRPI